MATEPLTFSRAMLWTFAGLTVLFLLVPILIIIITSFGNTTYMEFPPREWSLRWYRAYFQSERWISSTALSLQIAAGTTALATFLGTTAALGIVRTRSRMTRGIELFLLSPLVTPTIVLAVGLYFVFAPLQLVGSAFGIFLGHTVIATPLVILTVGAALRTIDPSLELAARSLGAGAWGCLWHVTLPMIRPAILGGGAFAFLTSFDEVVLAIFVGGPGATTLPKRMWDGIRFEIDPTLTAIASLLVLLTVIVLSLAAFSRRFLAHANAPRPDIHNLQR